MSELIFCASRPWNSLDAGLIPQGNYGREPQSNIEKCLYHCPFANGDCVNCLTGCKTTGIGRPLKCNPEILRELLRLRLTSEQICEKVGIGHATLTRYKAKIKEEQKI